MTQIDRKKLDIIIEIVGDMEKEVAAMVTSADEHRQRLDERFKQFQKLMVELGALEIFFKR